jgi:hypothetical protein
MSPYWQSQLEPMNRGFQNLSTAFMQLPRLRAQAALLAARQQEQQQAAQEASARTQLLNAQTSGLVAGRLNDQNLTGALKRYALNPQDSGAQADVISGFGQAYRKNPQGTAKALGDLFAQFAARTGSTNYPNMAALQGNAAQIADSLADNAEKAARPVVVGNGATLMAPTGQPLGSGGFTLNPGQQRYAPSYAPTPLASPPLQLPSAGPAGPASVAGSGNSINPAPASTGLQSPIAVNSQLPRGASRAAVSQVFNQAKSGGNTNAPSPGNLNAAPATPAALPPTSSVNPSVPLSQAAPPVAAQPVVSMIRVVHPSGQTGAIPSVNLPAALQAGYQLLPQSPSYA